MAFVALTPDRTCKSRTQAVQPVSKKAGRTQRPTAALQLVPRNPRDCAHTDYHPRPRHGALPGLPAACSSYGFWLAYQGAPALPGLQASTQLTPTPALALAANPPGLCRGSRARMSPALPTDHSFFSYTSNHCPWLTYAPATVL